MQRSLSVLIFISLVFFQINSIQSQSFSVLSRQADSLYRANGPSAAEPLHIKRVELSLSAYGDTSTQHLRANYDLCRVLYEQMKLDQLPARFSYIEAMLAKRNIELDPLLIGYYRVRLAHASFASDHPSGLVWAQKSMELCTRLYGENAPKTLDATNNVAFSLIRNKQYVKAKNTFLQLKNKIDQYNNKDIGAYISLYFNLAEIHEFEGDYQNAVKYFSLTKDLLDSVKDKANAVDIQLRILTIKILHLNNTANIQQWLYEHLDNSEAVYGKNTHQFAKAQIRVAEIFINQRIPQAAIPLLNESAEILIRVNGENSAEYAINLRALGNAYYHVNALKHAVEKHNQAYDIFEKKLKPGDREILFTLEHAIMDFQKLGDLERVDSLSKIYMAKSNEFEGIYEDRLHIKSILSKLYYRQGRLDLCAANANEYKTLVDSNQAAFKSRKLSDYWSIMTNLYQAEGNQEKSRDAIYQWMKVNDEDLTHRLFSISENDRLSFVHQFNEIHAYLLSSFLDKGYNAESAATVYNAILKHKSLVLQSNKAYENAISNLKDSAVIQLAHDWRSAKNRLSHLSSLPQNLLKNYDYDLEQLTRETQILEGKIIEQVPEISQYLTTSGRTWLDIQQALPPKSAAIDIVRFYHRNREEDAYDKIMYAVFIIRPGDKAPQIAFIENGNDLNSFLYERLCQEIKAQGKTSSTVFQAYWGKIEPFLARINTLYIAPDGIFHKINLAILQTSDGKLLSEKYQINTLPTLTNIVGRSNQAVSTSNATAYLIGNPQFDLQENGMEMPSTGNIKRSITLDNELPNPGTNLLPLPETAFEISDIAQILQSKGYTINTLLDTAATVTNVQKIQQSRILHIATHGYFLKSPKREKFLFNEEMTTDRPELRSMLFFAGASNTIRGTQLPEWIGDGILTALEAENLNLLNTELVVLSACDTGLGIIENGEGVFGLQRAFQIAGAKYVLISLWEVDDKETRNFMREFYQNYVVKNNSIPDAFHATQLNMLKTGKRISDWGAFVLIRN